MLAVPLPFAVTVTVVPLTDTVATPGLLDEIVPILPAGLVKVKVVVKATVAFLATALSVPLVADSVGATNPVGVTVISLVAPPEALLVRRIVTGFMIVLLLVLNCLICIVLLLP